MALNDDDAFHQKKKKKTLMLCFRVEGWLPTLSVRGGATYSRPDSFYIKRQKIVLKYQNFKVEHVTLSHLTGRKLES